GAGGEEQRQPRRRERAAGAAPALDRAVAPARAESCAPVARIEGTVMNIAIHRLATRAALAAILCCALGGALGETSSVIDPTEGLEQPKASAAAPDGVVKRERARAEAEQRRRARAE